MDRSADDTVSDVVGLDVPVSDVAGSGVGRPPGGMVLRNISRVFQV